MNKNNMLVKNSDSLKKPIQAEKRSKLLSFIQRHNSLSPISSSQNITSLKTTPKRIKRQSDSKSPQKTSLTNLRKSSLNLDICAGTPLQDSNFSTALSQIKEKLEKVEATSIMIEKWKEKLTIKEKELIKRENNIKEIEKLNEQHGNKLKDKEKQLDKREKEIKIKENNLIIAKEKMFYEVTQSLEKKSKEISEQERKLNLAIINIGKELSHLNKTKEEVLKIECLVLLNELIGSIVLADYQDKLNESGIENKYTSYEENALSEAFSSINEIERIEEVSNESSEDYYESNSLEYLKRREKILQDCEVITKENSEISDKLEALIASLQPSEDFD